MRAAEISPNSNYSQAQFAYLQLYEGKLSEAAASCRTINNQDDRLYCTAMVDHSLGHAPQARQALNEYVAKNAMGDAYQIAEIYAWRGENDKAFEWLDRAYRQRDTGLAGIKLDRSFARLHGDTRFVALLRKLKLPE